ncbi:MAG: chemotaxis protein CheC [Clostridiales Family XIII bacterium]|nr:chemotaxis protein CheC [Clostridiales Family XIII bacterium]
MITSYTELTADHIGVLRELGNIGAGNAATSLSVLLDEDVLISLPVVRIEDYDAVVTSVGGPEELAVSVLLNFSGEANGVILFLLSMEDAKDIMNILGVVDEEYTSGLSETKISAVKEIGNILGSSYLGSIASLTGINIDVSIPYIAIDMIGAILAAPVVQFGAEDSKVLYIEEVFSTGQRKLNGHVIMFTDVYSLKEILGRLGLEL